MRKSKQQTSILLICYCFLSILFCACKFQKEYSPVKRYSWNITSAKIEYISYRVRTRTAIKSIDEFESFSTSHIKFLIVDSLEAKLFLKRRLPNSTQIDLRRKLVISDGNGTKEVFYCSGTGICIWRNQYYEYDGTIRAVLSELIEEEW